MIAAKRGGLLIREDSLSFAGVDPSKEQWKELSGLIKKKAHNIFFDAAYLGFASGDVNKDAYSLHQVGGKKGGRRRLALSWVVSQCFNFLTN